MLKYRVQGTNPRFLIQSVGVRRDFAFLTSSQVTLMCPGNQGRLHICDTLPNIPDCANKQNTQKQDQPTQGCMGCFWKPCCTLCIFMKLLSILCVCAHIHVPLILWIPSCLVPIYLSKLILMTQHLIFFTIISSLFLHIYSSFLFVWTRRSKFDQWHFRLPTTSVTEAWNV